MMRKDQCRICLSPKHLTFIFDNQASMGLSTKIMSLAGIEIYPNDGLPEAICTRCLVKVNVCLEFIQLCKTTDTKLRSILITNSPENFTADIINESENVYECKYFPKTNFELDNAITETPPKGEEEKLESKEEELNKHEDCKNIKLLHLGKSGIKSKKSVKQQCSICGKVMSCVFRLRTHMKTHTGERPYSCPHCKKNFTLEQNLKVHIRIHTGDKPHHCSICGESFAQSGALTVHKRKHTGQTPYYCKLCGKRFRTVSNLQYHTRLHTGEKNFECETCGHAFITRSHLKQHMMIHTGEKPHVCCECKERFRRASHLKRHTQRIHGGSQKKAIQDK